MKKLCLLAFAGLALASCSSSDDSSSSSSGVLLKKVIENYGGGDVLTSNYTYNGSKLVKVVSDDNTVENYTYTGNLITKVEYVQDGDLLARETFSYNANDQLVEYVYADLDSDDGEKETYVWNSATNVGLTSYYGDSVSQTTLAGSGTIALTNGEVTGVTTDFGDGYTYTYDAKNNPVKNITGFDKIPFAGIEASGTTKHNMLTEVVTGAGNTYTSVYTYNADNYPTADTDTDDGGTDPISTQYFYN